MKDVQAGYESLIQHLFTKERADDVNIFGNFINAIDVNDKEEILRIKEKLLLGLDLDFVLSIINLYNLDGKILFGELTFFSNTGPSNHVPESFDYELGKQFILPKRNH